MYRELCDPWENSTGQLRADVHEGADSIRMLDDYARLLAA